METKDQKQQVDAMSGTAFLLSVGVGMACPYLVLAAVLDGSISKSVAVLLLLGCFTFGLALSWYRPLLSLLKRTLASRAS
jgi:hypothetical protein